MSGIVLTEGSTPSTPSTGKWKLYMTSTGLKYIDDAGNEYSPLSGSDIGVSVQAYDADIPTAAASQVEMEAGTETALRSMSPLRVKQAIDALGGGTFASTAEVQGTHTTGSITSGTAALTVASGTGITNGDYVVGEGITPGTTVSSGGGTTSITLSANANATLSSDPISFYKADKALSPGNTAGQLCRAWVNFNGTGTVAIRASYNVSSITDNGTGDYTVNFTTAMPDSNYVANANAGFLTGAYGCIVEMFTGGSHTDAPPTTSAFRFSTYTEAAVQNDPKYVLAIIFR